MGDYTFTIGQREVTVDVRCLWCGQSLEDGREETGFTGVGPDWGSAITYAGSDENRKPGTMLDYGCDDSPDTSEDSSGSHAPNVLPTWDGHLLVLDIEQMGYAQSLRRNYAAIEHLDDGADRREHYAPVPVPAGVRYAADYPPVLDEDGVPA